MKHYFIVGYLYMNVCLDMLVHGYGLQL